MVRNLKPTYTDQEELKFREFRLELRPDLERVESHANRPVGFRLTTPEKNRVVQIRLNGVTYSWLKPYSTWPELRTAARQVWETYAEHLDPDRFVRVAVRYINHIPLPLPISDLRDFLPATPDLPSEWPQMMTGFLSRIALVDEASGDQAVVTQTSEQGADPGVMNFLLDIDCFNASPPQEPTEVWGLLDRLRDFKNQIFFSSVTERLLEGFE